MKTNQNLNELTKDELIALVKKQRLEADKIYKEVKAVFNQNNAMKRDLVLAFDAEADGNTNKRNLHLIDYYMRRDSMELRLRVIQTANIAQLNN